MSFTPVQNTGSTGSNVATFVSSVTAGDLVVVRAATRFSSRLFLLSSMADSAANTYHLAATANVVADDVRYCVEIWYSNTTAGGSALAVTYTPGAGSTGDVAMSIAEYSHSGLGATQDGLSDDTGSGISLTSGTWSTTGASDLIVGAGIVQSTSVSFTAGTGFTGIYSASGAGGVASLYAEDELGVAAGSINTPMTSSITGSWACVGAAFTAGVADTLSAAPGAFSLSGIAATITKSLGETTAPGAFALTGKAAALAAQHKVSAAAGTFALSGIAATFALHTSVIGTKGVFLLAGPNQLLSTQRHLVAAPGTFALTGDAAAFAVHISAAESAGAFALTGEAAVLSRDGSVTLTTTAGIFTLTGKPTIFTAQRLTAAACGHFALTGNADLFEAHLSLVAAPGVFALSGSPVSLGWLMPLSYAVFANTGIGDPINYNSPVAVTTALTWSSSDLAFPGTWSFGVRAQNLYGVEQNLDCAVTFVLDAFGRDVTNIPAPPVALSAIARAGGKIRVDWSYSTSRPGASPRAFHVYVGTSGPPSYATPAATIAATAGTTSQYSTILSGLSGGVPYQIGVRAANAFGEEQNTRTVAVVALTMGPSGVVGLRAIATSASG